MDTRKLQKKLDKRFGGRFKVEYFDGALHVSGNSDTWSEIIEACSLCVQKKGSKIHVVNDITFVHHELPTPRHPSLRDDYLEGRKPDVLIIGGGISGASIARELSKWKLDILLVEKEMDLAMQASGRNDGEVHPGVDLNKGLLKQEYVLKGNKMYEKVCSELGVPFKRCGQYVCFTDNKIKPLIRAYAWQRKHICGVKDTKIISREELLKAEPHVADPIKYAMYNPSAGCVCPYGLTIAFAENAVKNGAEVSLSTIVEDMSVENGKITKVVTNRGNVYPTVVINAAGVFSEDIAKMAGDRFFSIHPRKGTDIIMDRKKGGQMMGIATIKELGGDKHTKGGGILHTVHDNLLFGPDAVETYLKEDYSTARENVDHVFTKQQRTIEDISKGDIITYFSGVRAATFEEDFIIEEGRKTHNLIHCAGIQSPGLTTAPAVALDIEKMTVEMLKRLGKEPKVNESFDPIRKPIPALRELPDEERNALIKKNPDYGIVICRCEEISKGEILDALRSPIPVATVDGVKRRVRPGMGRCQGGFCMPLVSEIISEEFGIDVKDVMKSTDASFISFGQTKEVRDERV